MEIHVGRTNERLIDGNAIKCYNTKRNLIIYAIQCLLFTFKYMLQHNKDPHYLCHSIYAIQCFLLFKFKYMPFISFYFLNHFHIQWLSVRLCKTNLESLSLRLCTTSFESLSLRLCKTNFESLSLRLRKTNH